MTRKSTFCQKSRNWARRWDGKYAFSGFTLFICKAFIPGKTGYVHLYFFPDEVGLLPGFQKYITREYDQFLKDPDCMREASPAQAVMARTQGENIKGE